MNWRIFSELHAPNVLQISPDQVRRLIENCDLIYVGTRLDGVEMYREAVPQEVDCTPLNFSKAGAL